jgi:hypothetical protein
VAQEQQEQQVNPALLVQALLVHQVLQEVLVLLVLLVQWAQQAQPAQLVLLD